MTVILGINQYHTDSAACLLIDGKLVGAVAEERLGKRVKHESGFPKQAIRWLLHANGLKVSDITHIALPRNSRANWQAKLAWVFKHPSTGGFAAIEHFKRNKKSTSFAEQLANIDGTDPSQITASSHYVEHHLAHIASAYYPSEFETLTAGFSYDGSGDFASAMAAQCEGTNIKVIDRVLLPQSLGFYYTSLCHYLGFTQFGEEYKVMGLAAHGNNNFAEEMNALAFPDKANWFKLENSYFKMHSGNSSDITNAEKDSTTIIPYQKKLLELLGPARAREEPLRQRHKDIAHSMQKQFEHIAINNLNKLHELVKTDQLALAGGCALNGVLNGQISKETRFTQTYIPSAPGDDGTCIGAAYWVWHNVLKKTERFPITHAFWGPEYSEKDIRLAAEQSKYSIEHYPQDNELLNVVADLIADGSVVGWYQGRSEWGPRALGNRSILANPAAAGMQELLNSKIKKRETFRPFAPSVLVEDEPIFFNAAIKSPFMMHVVDLKETWHKRLPAITHVDGTARVQSVSEQANPRFHKLIVKVKQRTGIGMVLNTSFNENEPIVNTPEQAIDCFDRTNIDALCLHNFILRKR